MRIQSTLLLGALLAGCTAPASFDDAAPVGSHDGAIVYGVDDRVDSNSHPDMLMREFADSVALVTWNWTIQSTNPTTGEVTLDETTLSDDFEDETGDPLCDGETFADDALAGRCTAFLIAPDRLVTAGHCFYKDLNDPYGNPTTLANHCGNHAYVFDFARDATGQRETIDADDVFHCEEVLDYYYDGSGVDYAVVQLDRPTNRQPLPIDESATMAAGDDITVIGHPDGILQKIADGGEVRSVESWGATAWIDTFHGNSGSPIIAQDTNQVVGILVRGATDYRRGEDDCWELNVTSSSPTDTYESFVGIDQIGQWLDVGEPNQNLAVASDRVALMEPQQLGTAAYETLGLRDGQGDRNHRAISWPGDEDWIAIPVIHGDEIDVTIAFDGNAADLDLQITDHAGVVQDTSAAGWSTSESVSYALTGNQSGYGAQVVYARVWGHNGATAPYSLTVDVTPAAMDLDGDGTAEDLATCGGDLGVTCPLFLGAGNALVPLECSPRANRIDAIGQDEVLDLSGEAGVCEPQTWSHRVYVDVATDHPYANNENATFDIHLPAGATSASFYATDVDTETGYDFVVLGDGTRHSGNLGATTFTNPTITETAPNGMHRPTAHLGFTSDPSFTRYGFLMHAIDWN